MSPKAKRGGLPELPFDVGPKVYEVGELTEEIRSLLRGRYTAILVEGEIAGIRKSGAGHVYFAIKDSDAKLSCAMFRQKAMRVQRFPDEGERVRLRGTIDVYPPRGDYQLIVEHIEAVGEGLLREQFEALKRSLKAEGLFDTDRKQPLPPSPKVVGVVTSAQTAALRDIVRVIHDRMPSVKILVSPARVQGKGAARELSAALRRLDNHRDVEVIILTRGGGSLEDLWEFNDELLARAIAACTTPVISAVGHEVDYSISDFVADVRAATPSHAGELAVPDGRDVIRRMERLGLRLHTGMQQRIEQRNRRLLTLGMVLRRPPRKLSQMSMTMDSLQGRLSAAMDTRLHGNVSRLHQLQSRLQTRSPVLRVQRSRSLVDMLEQRLKSSMQPRVHRQQMRLQRAEAALRGLDPTRVLARGYGIVLDDQGRAVTDATQVSSGDGVRMLLHKGSLHAVVDAVSPDDAAEKT